MRKIFLGFVLALAMPAFGQMAPVADRVAKQNALFEEFYETQYRIIQSTAVGQRTAEKLGLQYDPDYAPALAGGRLSQPDPFQRLGQRSRVSPSAGT